MKYKLCLKCRAPWSPTKFGIKLVNTSTSYIQLAQTAQTYWSRRGAKERRDERRLVDEKCKAGRVERWKRAAER